MDITIQAASGAIAVTGFADGPPVKAGPAIADFLSGTHLYGAILTALYDRERTGLGRLVEVAMIEAMFPTLASSLGMLHSNRDNPLGRTGNRHSGLAVSPYNVYACQDGWFAIICNSGEHWANLCAAMGRPELTADPRFARNSDRVQNMAATDAAVEAWAGGLTRREIFEATGAHRVPSAPVRELTEVLDNAHMRGRGMIEQIDHPSLGHIAVPGSPMRYHGTLQAPATPSAALGQDNVQVYGELLGLGAEEVEVLQREGVI